MGAAPAAAETGGLVAPGTRRRRVAAGRYVAVGLGLVAAAVVGVSARRPVPRQQRTALSIQDDQVDDAMTVACIDADLASFMGKLQELAGYVAMVPPTGGVLLTDRGSYNSIYGGAYDSAAAMARVVAGYDAALAACVADPAACHADFGAGAPTCSLAVGAEMPWPQITCVESCVQDLFFAVDGGAYAHCKDPVSAAMILTPELFKSCLSGASACTRCVDACLALDAAPLETVCGGIDAGGITRAPAHHAVPSD